eukprot:TRINITY_DN33850_c0_g1_i1.p1 TRINITY_DN33850_c0_g1~~TRINITY_DN33850_c0_g1_i1.p1  ORF type:complete len:232 (+),score=48.72 TRINITY_DN33850_c0_g1_i1:70-765(+)
MVRIDFWRTPWERSFSKLHSRFYGDKAGTSSEDETPDNSAEQDAITRTRSVSSESELRNALAASADLHKVVEEAKEMARQKMNELADRHQLSVKTMQADGNCLFRALAYGMNRKEDQHKLVRAQIIEQLRATPERYMYFVHEAYEEYVERMSRDGEYGDHVTLQAAADALRREILVFTDSFGSENEVITVRPTEVAEDSDCDSPRDELRQIPVFFYADEAHYDAGQPYVSL